MPFFFFTEYELIFFTEKKKFIAGFFYLVELRGARNERNI